MSVTNVPTDYIFVSKELYIDAPKLIDAILNKYGIKFEEYDAERAGSFYKLNTHMEQTLSCLQSPKKYISYKWSSTHMTWSDPRGIYGKVIA